MTPLPHRIQRRRTKGWRMPPGAINCGRPSKWGNQYRIGDVVQDFNPTDICRTTRLATATDCYNAHRTLFQYALRGPGRRFVCEALDEIRGKDLACFCSPCQPCHADTLLILANAPRES